jgi:hypothetical protein
VRFAKRIPAMSLMLPVGGKKQIIGHHRQDGGC